MPNYEINHVILGPGPTDKVDPAKVPEGRVVFKPGEIVAENVLREAGFDIGRLTTAKEGGFAPAIKLVRGTEGVPDPPTARELAAQAEAAKQDAKNTPVTGK